MSDKSNKRARNQGHQQRQQRQFARDTQDHLAYAAGASSSGDHQTGRGGVCAQNEQTHLGARQKGRIEGAQGAPYAAQLHTP